MGTIRVVGLRRRTEDAGLVQAAEDLQLVLDRIETLVG